MMIHKGYEDSHFDYFGQSRVIGLIKKVKPLPYIAIL